MCQTARFNAQRPNATRGRSRNDSDRAHVAVARDRPEHARGQHEDEQRPAHREDHQRDAESPISTCWSMCTQRRWFSPIVSIGEMSPMSDDDDAGAEEGDAAPRREIGAPTAPQAEPALQEERGTRARCPRRRRAAARPGCVGEEHG